MISLQWSDNCWRLRYFHFVFWTYANTFPHIPSFNYTLHVTHCSTPFCNLFDSSTTNLFCFSNQRVSPINVCFACSKTYYLSFPESKLDLCFISSWQNSRFFLPSIFFCPFYSLNSSVVYLNIKYLLKKKLHI